MTIKEAILKSLEDLRKITNSNEIYNHIISNKYYDFKLGKTPVSTVSAQLGDFIRGGDTRIKRFKNLDSTYSYYLTKYEDLLTEDIQPSEEIIKPISTRIKTYEERDLHILLSSYLRNSGIHSKTIFHEQSQTSKDGNQIWTHPDMVGIRFLNLQSQASHNLLRVVNRMETFNIMSYELKKEINSDSDLKRAFFQAVSNSSWANYGYLVAFEISSNLMDEMQRLNNSFGIGIIELAANPFESKMHFQATYRKLDFKTIDKLCKMNKTFEQFVEHVEKLMTAEQRYYKSTEKELGEFCDRYFSFESEFEKYCRESNIPLN